MIYMSFHEGRGIGLTNKIRAYKIQEKGVDTLKANEELGFEHDLRDFRPAVEVLKFLKVKQIQLLTNNPLKVISLESNGIKVLKRISLDAPVNEHNLSYIITKKDLLNHSFSNFASP